MRDMVADAVRDHERAVHDISEKNDARRIALAKTFGLTHWPQLVKGPRGLLRVSQGEAFRPGPGFESLGHAYTAFTGDENFQRVAQLGVSDFPSALADVMNSLLVKDYAGDAICRWREIVTSFSAPENFKLQQRSRIRHIEDLPDVGNDAPYEELVSHSDEGFSFQVNAKGGTLTITRAMIINDQVGAVKRLVEQAGRAAWRTLAKRCWSRVINNDLYPVDGVAMFNAAHGGNLGSAALSVTALNAARAVIFAQTEPGSTERLGQSGPYFLVVPIDLEATAFGINEAEFEPGKTDGTPNPWHHRFGDHGERIFANPLMTDPSDWLLFDVSGNAGILEIGFLNGRQMPEFFVSSPDKDQGFRQDRLVWKIRHEYEVVIDDYRAAYKAVVS